MHASAFNHSKKIAIKNTTKSLFKANTGALMRKNQTAQQFIPSRMLAIAATGLALLTAAPVFAQDVRTINSNNGNGTASIRVLADSYSDKSGAVADSQSRIIFYRPVDATKDNAGTVYVNGMYHASIVAGGYSPICLKPGATDVGVRDMKYASGAKDGLDSVSVVTTHPGQTTFVRVQDTGSRWTLQTVPEQQAEQQLEGTKLQVHTISRVIERQGFAAFLLHVDRVRRGHLAFAVKMLALHGTRIGDDGATTGGKAGSTWGAEYQRDQECDAIFSKHDQTLLTVV